MTSAILQTSIVGSYPQPGWLINRPALLGKLCSRVRSKELWLVDEAELEAAQDAATLAAIRDQEEAGLDVLTDGEIRREAYSNRFATALEGMDPVNHGSTLDRVGKQNVVPRVVGPLKRVSPVQVRDVEFMKKHARPGTKIKITIPGPFTMSQQCQDDFYGSKEKVAMALAACVRDEVIDLFKAGADIVQLDEPYVQARPEDARAFAVAAIDAALDGVRGPGQETALHVCFGYAHVHKTANAQHEKPPGYSFLPELDKCKHVDEISIECAQPKDLDLKVLTSLPSKRISVGVIDMSRNTIETTETPDEVAERIRAGLVHLPAERFVASMDCGMKYLPREVAQAKMCALTIAAATVREELAAKRRRLE